MTEVKIAGGHVLLIDDADHDTMKQHPWWLHNCDGWKYPITHIDGQRVRLPVICSQTNWLNFFGGRACMTTILPPDQQVSDTGGRGQNVQLEGCLIFARQFFSFGGQMSKTVQLVEPS